MVRTQLDRNVVLLHGQIASWEKLRSWSGGGEFEWILLSSWEGETKLNSVNSRGKFGVIGWGVIFDPWVMWTASYVRVGNNECSNLWSWSKVRSTAATSYRLFHSTNWKKNTTWSDRLITIGWINQRTDRSISHPNKTSIVFPFGLIKEHWGVLDQVFYLFRRLQMKHYTILCFNTRGSFLVLLAI